MRPDDAQPTTVDRIVVTLDVSPGADVGQASVAWLHDAYDSLVGRVIALDSDTAELSGTLGRTGDASLAGGMWTSPVTEDGWHALAASLVSQARGDASWWVGWLSDAESDEPWARADATLEQDGVGVALSAEVAGLRADLPWPSVESALVDLLVRHGDGVASFGCVGSPLEGGSTALDDALRRPRAASLGESRQWLRGYDWATLVPAELAGRIDRRRAEDELARVVELTSAGLVLVGTDRFSAFDEAALERVFGVVEPVLPRGEPQRPRIYGDEQMPRLVWRAPHDDAV